MLGRPREEFGGPGKLIWLINLAAMTIILCILGEVMAYMAKPLRLFSQKKRFLIVYDFREHGIWGGYNQKTSFSLLLNKTNTNHDLYIYLPYSKKSPDNELLVDTILHNIFYS